MEKKLVIYPSADIIADWQKFYKEIDYPCGDLSDVEIPDDPGGFGRDIIMAKGSTPQTAYDLCVKHFRCWKQTDENLDKIVKSERTAGNGHYAIHIRDCIVGITLEERFIYELKYFKETGKHLDIHNTLCAASRFTNGRVPKVKWGDYYTGMFVYGPSLFSPPSALCILVS